MDIEKARAIMKWLLDGNGRVLGGRCEACQFAVAAGALLALFGGIGMRRLAAAPAENTAAGESKSLAAEFDLTPKLLASGKGKSDDDPLRAIFQRMSSVHHDLSELKIDEPVQTKERQVVRSLDELIAALERHCSGLGKGNVPNGGRKDSIIVKGDPTMGDLHGVDPNARQWSQLPAKVRGEILQSKTEGFPPGYEGLLQSYYRQLADEKSLGDKAAAPAAGSK